MDHATPSTTALLADAAAAALASDPDDRRLWDLIYALQERASREVFEAAAAWCRSPSPPLRRLGATCSGSSVSMRASRSLASPSPCSCRC